MNTKHAIVYSLFWQPVRLFLRLKFGLSPILRKKGMSAASAILDMLRKLKRARTSACAPRACAHGTA